MKASSYFAPILLTLAACGTPAAQASPAPRSQAVRVVGVRTSPMVAGRRYLAEVVPEVSVRVLAQVAGTVSRQDVGEGESASRGAPLVRIAAPDVAARAARARAERRRAQTQRDYSCAQLGTDRALAQTGDLTSSQLDRSDNSCASARLAAEAATAAEREVGVMRTRATERAPFDGYVLAHLVDEGQTVMPGTPLLQFASDARRLRLRVPASDLADVSVGSRVRSELGWARVVDMSPQALGPGRLVEVLAHLEEPGDARVGASVDATLVVAEDAHPCAVPSAAVGEDDQGSFVYVAEQERVRRVAVTLGVRDLGWVAVTPALDAGARVVSPLVALDPSRPIFAVAP